MGSQPANEEILQNIIQETDARLEEVENPRFSLPASSVLKKKVKEYIRQLVSESVKVSKRHQADTVSAAYVERASDYLVFSTSRRLFRYLGRVGCVLLGVSLSATVAMIGSGQCSAVETLLSVSFGIVGGSLLVLDIAKD